ncbi:MAG: hypothetical protein OXC62_09135 [Aestuariivita sp.]|nr:hypothetical protein [Aestuariivita sp.]
MVVFWMILISPFMGRKIIVFYLEIASGLHLTRLSFPTQSNELCISVMPVSIPSIKPLILSSMPRKERPDLWEERHGTRPVLCKTLVDPTQFDGACNKVAYGQPIRTKAGQRKSKPAKDITVKPFDPHFRAFLKRGEKTLSKRNRQQATLTSLREDPPLAAMGSRMINAATRIALHHLDRHAVYLTSRPLRRTSWRYNRGG